MAGLIATPVELNGDEAQYWRWSHTLAFGYFSKPPLVAWMAAATTALFGDSEWAIRLSAPFAHAATALLLMATARRRWGDEAAAWTGALYITMPAVWLSAAILSTDAFLLTLWAGALWAYDRYVDRPNVIRALALGVFIGLGFLAKYAMVYFVVSLVLLGIFHKPSRQALLKPATLAAAAVVALCIAPNLIWNASHDFATISHTAANANWGAENFRVDELFGFVASQFGVFGPIAFAFLLWSFVAVARARPEERERWLPLIAFAAPPLLIVTVQAFLNRANANWAVAAYASGSILFVAWALERRLGRWLWVSFAFHCAVGLVFSVAALSPWAADRVGLANSFKRTRGWEETAALVSEFYRQGDYAAVLADNRLLFHELDYYGRTDPVPLRMWWRYAGATSHAEASAPMTAVDGPVLVVVERGDDEAKVRADFASSEPGVERTIVLGGGKERVLRIFTAEGFAPLPRGPEYEARWEAE